MTTSDEIAQAFADAWAEQMIQTRRFLDLPPIRDLIGTSIDAHHVTSEEAHRQMDEIDAVIAEAMKP